jgi:hypothetical protein
MLCPNTLQMSHYLQMNDWQPAEHALTVTYDRNVVGKRRPAASHLALDNWLTVPYMFLYSLTRVGRGRIFLSHRRAIARRIGFT